MNLGDIIKLPKMRPVNGTRTCFMYQAQKNVGYNEAIKEIREMEAHESFNGWCRECGAQYLLLKGSIKMVCPKCERELKKEIE